MSRTSYRELIDFAAGERGSLTTTLKAHLKTHRAAATTVALYRLARATLLADDGVAPSAAAVASARALFPPQRARAAAEGIADHVAMILGRLIFDSRAEPALAGLRGPASGFQLTFELPDAQLDLQAEPVGGHGGSARWRLVGQLACTGTVPEMKVELHHGGSNEPVQTVDAQERGIFTFDTGPGLYELHLRLPEATIVIPEIDIS